jgi:hypothetical protein
MTNPLHFPGGAEGDRTPGLMNAIHALSHLSYSPDLEIMITTRLNDVNKILTRLSNQNYNTCPFKAAGVVKLVDALDSKSCGQ